MPPAPGRFSTTNDTPSNSPMRLATAREVVSVTPPGVNGTIQLIGLVGNVWANAA